MKFSGFGDWVEIFTGGKQVDSAGNEHDGDAIIDKAIATFDPSKHEPPAVIGHPEENSPAYAWVEALKGAVKDGKKTLLVRFKNVVPEFEEWVKKGAWKKRSAAFYADGRLRHVGFLGGMPPAVKGLKDIGFNEAGVTFEFADPEGAPKYHQPEKTGGKNMFKEKIKNFLTVIGIDASKVPDDALPDDLPDNLKGKAFSEADLEAAKTKAAEEGKKQAASEFAEKTRNEAKSRRRGEISTFCDREVAEGRILPAWLKMGLKEFMESLDAEEVVQFAEGDAGKKSRSDWFKSFLEELPRTVEFKEVAKREEGASNFSDADKAQTEAGLRIAARVNPKKN